MFIFPFFMPSANCIYAQCAYNGVCTPLTGVINMTNDTIHAWEAAGLGKAPFECIGMFSLPSPSLAAQNPSAYNNQLRMMPKGFSMGTCAACGQALINNYMIEAASGERFSVGCDCVNKTGSAGLIKKVDQIKKKVAADKRREAKERRLAMQRAQAEAKLAAQRARNGGLTDHEVRQQKEERQRWKRIEVVATTLGPVINALALKQDRGSFARDMLDTLNRGYLPNGRALEICCEIYAKHQAQQVTGKTRGKLFDQAKMKAMEHAKQLFEDTKQPLADSYK